MNKTPSNSRLLALVRLCVFVIVFCLLFVVIDNHFFADNAIHPTWSYVADPEHEPIDILFVGNSHTYTSIDAEMISKATGLNVRALTCSSMNGENVAANVEAFLNYEIPKVLVLEVCPFSVNNFETMRNDKLGIVFQHFDGIPDIMPRLKALSQVSSLENIPSGAFQLLRNTFMWSRWEDLSNQTTYDAYGSAKKYDVLLVTPPNPDTVRKSFSTFELDNPDHHMFEQNRIALLKILTLSQKKGFDVWIYNAPITRFQEDYAAPLSYIDSIKDEYPRIQYVDNAMLHLDTIGITATDFFDNGHLNPNGMYKVTVWMTKNIGQRFQVEVDPDPSACYQGSYVSMLEDNTYRYTFAATGDNLYRFVYSKGKTVVDTGYTAQNYFDDIALTKTVLNKLKVYVLPQGLSDDQANASVYCFLPYSLDEYTATVKDEHTIEITNESNFSDNLTFAWYFLNNETQETKQYDYQASNTIEHTFTQSGTYDVHAYTRQMSDDMHSWQKIMTITYDAATDQLKIDWSVSGVTVK